MHAFNISLSSWITCICLMWKQSGLFVGDRGIIFFTEFCHKAEETHGRQKGTLSCQLWILKVFFFWADVNCTKNTSSSHKIMAADKSLHALDRAGGLCDKRLLFRPTSSQEVWGSSRIFVAAARRRAWRVTVRSKWRKERSQGYDLSVHRGGLDSAYAE